MIIGIGSDLVDSARFQAHLEKCPALLKRLFTPYERNQCAGRGASLAARFAAKEAVLKALGDAQAAFAASQNVPAWRYQEIEVRTHSSGAPRLELSGMLKVHSQQLGTHNWRLSLSHDGSYALAVVLLQNAS